LRISKPDDESEVEASDVADRIMRSAEPGEGAARPRHQEGEKSAGAFAGPEVSARMRASRGSGQGLDAGMRDFMEDRFGADLGGVRIHADGEAAELSRGLNARAFTLGSDIFFGAGHYRPETSEGRHLIAHELTHVRQGGTGIRRCADKSDEASYDGLIAEIQKLDSFTKLDAKSKTTADSIIKDGKAKPNCLYHATWLKVLFTTKEKDTKKVAEEIRAETATAVKAEDKRLDTKEAKKTLDVEEAATADPEPEPAPAEPGKKAAAPPKKPGRTWTTYPTRFGKGTYKVDATDLTNIFVKVKVNLTPGGEGTWDDVKSIKRLEDAIEKHASTKGFTVNVEFVNPENKPDFVPDADTVKINANPRWPNATNWGGDARGNAHELFHVLNFPLDRYNYIESQSLNKKMVISERLIWFRAQMDKPKGFDNPESLMASGQHPIEEDVCTIAQVDKATCLKAREKLNPPGLDVRAPFAFVLPTAGYANIGGSSGAFLNYGVDLGIPLTLKGDWELFIGAHASYLRQLEGEQRTAFLIGARIGIEKLPGRKQTGLNFGGFAEGGAVLVSDKTSPADSGSFVPGAYAYGGVNLGYKGSASLSNLSINAELGGGVTSQVGLHDPQTYVQDSKRLPFFTAGIRAAWAF